MNILKRKTLDAFMKKHPASKTMFNEWYAQVKKEHWQSPNDVLLTHGRSSILSNGRIVFRIKGNHYRIVASVNYNAGFVWIKFIGTHAQYDKINAETISDY